MQYSDNKRIALNTVVLYIKLILSIVIGLYTSRVVLLSLGISDYGLYTIVGGVVSMLNFLGITMMSVTYRYIIVEFGKKEKGNPQKVFNTSLVIHLVLVVVLLFVGETFGVYYVEHIANIDYSKIDDALFVLHLSLAATSFVIVSIPFNGLIVAREKFVFTAFVEIGRTLMKLGMVIALSYYMGNRLRMFAVIMAIYNIALPICMYIYCFVKELDIIRWNFNKRKCDYVDILGYAFWIMAGALASMGQNQGSNMIINLFFNTEVNAAFGIGTQVNNYVMTFVRGLNQAAQPQIMKSQGHDDSRSSSLVYITTRYSYLILLIMFFPLISNIDYILKLWLKEVPVYTSMFVCVLLVTSLIRCLGTGFDAMIQATGKIKTNQIVYSIAYLAILPLAFILYKYGFPLITINILILITSMFFVVFQLFYLSKITSLTISGYLHSTILPCIKVTIVCLPLLFVNGYLPDTFIGFAISLMFSLAWCVGFAYLWGMQAREKQIMLNQIQKAIAKIK